MNTDCDPYGKQTWKTGRAVMSTMFGSDGSVTVSYVDYEEFPYCGSFVAHVDASDLNVAQLPAVAKAINEGLDFVTGASVRLNGNGEGVEILVATKSTDSYGRSYDSTSRREAISGLLKPTCVRKVSATANVVRDATGKHTATKVVVALSVGESFKGLSAKDLSSVTGVNRARVTPDGTQIVFTMTNPVVTDDDGKVTEVVEAVAASIKALLIRPMEAVRDANPDAALDEANDYEAPAAKKS